MRRLQVCNVFKYLSIANKALCQSQLFPIPRFISFSGAIISYQSKNDLQKLSSSSSVHSHHFYLFVMSKVKRVCPPQAATVTQHRRPIDRLSPRTCTTNISMHQHTCRIWFLRSSTLLMLICRHLLKIVLAMFHGVKIAEILAI